MAELFGWGRLENGDLLTIAEQSGYGLFLTADKNLSPWPLVWQHITAMVDAATPGSFAEVDIPLPPKKPFLQS